MIEVLTATLLLVALVGVVRVGWWLLRTALTGVLILAGMCMLCSLTQ